MSYELWLTKDNGDRLVTLNNIIRFNYSRTLNGIGRGQFVLPNKYDFSLFKRDYRIEVWRPPKPKAKKRLENIYFIRRIMGTTLVDGNTHYTIYGSGPNELLKRRIVAYNSGTSEASKTDYIDDMMKAVVRENLGALAAAARDYTANGFSVQPDVSLGPSITKSFSRRNVLTLLQDLSEIAHTNGTDVYFAIIPTSTTTFEFQTYIGQPGVDRRYPEGESPLEFSLAWGNLAQPNLDDDYEEEANFIYAGGQGEGDGRNIQTAQDDDRINQSIWNRREAFRDARLEETNAGVLAEAEYMLASSRPKRRFSASLLSTERSRYGIDWDFGDRGTAKYLGQTLDALIRVININVDEQGLETVEARVEVEDVA